MFSITQTVKLSHLFKLQLVLEQSQVYEIAAGYLFGMARFSNG